MSKTIRSTSSAVAVRNEFLPFAVPDLGHEEIDAVVKTLRSGWLTTGPNVREFERAFAEYLGVRHAIAVNSATAGLHLALDAVGIAEGDEVIVPTMTFAATAEVVVYLKAKPVLVDCDPQTLNIDPAAIERSITSKTRAIIPVHMAGYPCDIAAIKDIAARHDLRVIDDAAHALPTRYNGRLIGTTADITCFSFYATKTITTGEGGMITTDSDEFAERMRVMSLHGISRDAWKRYTAEGSWSYEILYPGFKYNMTDIAAALGIEQLKKCDRFWRTRVDYARRYCEGLNDLDALETPLMNKNAQHAWHLYIVKLNLDRLGCTRAEFIERLRDANIGASVHFIPLHMHPYYKNCGYTLEQFPVATRLAERIVSLPLYPRMTIEDVDYVIAVVRNLIKGHRR